jgi:hypothetical protein
MTISGSVATISGAVVTIFNAVTIPILIFRCGFCRWEGGEPFHGDDFLKGGVLWSKSRSKKIWNHHSNNNKKAKYKRKLKKKVQIGRWRTRFYGSKIKMETLDLVASGLGLFVGESFSKFLCWRERERN